MPKIIKIAILFIAAVFTACDEEELKPEPEPYRFKVPEHFPEPVFNTQNPMSKEGIGLGRMLFYDARLSANNKISCASCHDPRLAFADGTRLSTAGVAGTQLLRHAPALFNLAWASNGLFWDGGSTNLESQVFGPLTAHDEMAQNLYELIDELNAVPAYVAGFRDTFHEPVSSQNIAKALAQFQRSLVSANSRYDRYRQNVPGSKLTPDELAGQVLVQQNCQVCHAGELFTDQEYHNNGIDDDFSNTDHEGVYTGRSRITYDLGDLGKFRTPSLRNLFLTAPYMHDGRFGTLEAVLEHYSSGIKTSATLDPRLPASGLNLSSVQKKQILAFLNTLTDQALTQNPEYQKPELQ